MSVVLDNSQFEQLVKEVKDQLLSESQGVGEVEVVSSLSGINSLPALRWDTVVEAPLELLSAPAEEAAAKAYEAIAGVQTATDNANTATTAANTAATSANKAAEKVDNTILDLTEEKEIIANVAVAETERAEAEDARKEAETARVEAENIRVSSENARKLAEIDRSTAEESRIEAEKTRIANENVRETDEVSRNTAESSRRTAEVNREKVKSDMETLNQEIKNNPPKINESGNWEVWDALNKTYADTGKTALGKSPIIVNGTWWIWNDDTGNYEDTGASVNADFVLTREITESALGGAPIFYLEEWNHLNSPFRSGTMVKFNQEFFVALKDTDVPPVNLLLLGDGIIAKIDEHTYATVGSYDAEGNTDDWRKIPYDELRLVSRWGTLDGVETDVRNLSGSDVYKFQPNLEIDMLKGTINGMKFNDLVSRMEAIEKKLGL